MRQQVKEYDRVHVNVKICFQTAFHVGSGLEGEAGSDHGILTDIQESPVLPGSSIKGIFRSNCEKLVATLAQDNLWACGLNNGLYSQQQCVGGGLEEGSIYKDANKQFQESNGQNIQLIEKNLCSVCSLFGSPLSSGRIFFHDAHLENPDDYSLTKRDGVGIDRDSGTAVPKIKYEYDVANAGLEYSVKVELEDTCKQDLLLLALGLLDWQHSGLRIGGKTTRGLGHASLKHIQVSTVDFSEKSQRVSYLLRGEMQNKNNPEEFLQKCVEEFLTTG